MTASRAARALFRLRLAGGSRLPVILQSEAAECGLACLAMILTYHGHQADLGSLRRQFSTSLKGMTLLDLSHMAMRLGLSARGVRLEPEDLPFLKVPAILHWEMNHFVVLERAGPDGIIIHDPARGRRRCTGRDVDHSFTGVALELAPVAGFERKRDTLKLPLSALLGRIDSLGSTVGQALLLSLLLQLFLLAAPLYMQLVVDQAVAKGNAGILTGLAVGFGLLALLNLGCEWLRSRVLLALGGVMSFQMTANLFHHLVRLPLDWFEKRHIGDLVSRFGSTRPIKELIANDLIAVAVDGTMAVLTLLMIFIYSPALASIVLVALLLSALIRLFTFGLVRNRQEELIDSTAKEQTVFIESARAIQAIKLFNRELDREDLWQNRLVDVVNHSQRLGRMQTNIKLFGGLVLALENILVIYFGARLVMSSTLTVGMLYAFVAYKTQLLDKGARLLETAIQFRMLDLHLQRIADIAHSEQEEGLDGEPLVRLPIEGRLAVEALSYRYSDSDPWVFENLSFKVEPGEFLAITGPSGQGKTTLLKVMLGLLKASDGRILVDGMPLDRIGAADYRRQVGAVMQDDQLLSGSLAENIAFFDTTPDLDQLRCCARIAGIDEEIMAMPMNYNTLVGDMGTGLSGGQKQRILLARALYRKPRILFMDEGTSHLDLDRERQVNLALRQLRMTRIIVAHRPDTVASADRVLILDAGGLREGAPDKDHSGGEDPPVMSR